MYIKTGTSGVKTFSIRFAGENGVCGTTVCRVFGERETCMCLFWLFGLDLVWIEPESTIWLVLTLGLSLQVRI